MEISPPTSKPLVISIGLGILKASIVPTKTTGLTLQRDNRSYRQAAINPSDVTRRSIYFIISSSIAQYQMKQPYAVGLMVFSSQFRVEAKEFVVSINDSGIVKLSKWDRGYQMQFAREDLELFGW